MSIKGGIQKVHLNGGEIPKKREVIKGGWYIFEMEKLLCKK